MAIKAIIVEDEQNNVEIIKHFVQSYCKQVEILGESGTVSGAQELVKEHQPDLIFLDIKLEEGTGFDLLEIIQEKSIQVIFITAYNEFAVKAFKYSAVDYLLKPLQIDQLVEAVNQAESRMSSNSVSNQMKILMNQLSGANELTKSEDDFIAIPMAEKIEFLKINEITSIQAEGKYSIFKMADGETIVSSKNIGEYEKTLSDNSLFFRVHNTYLVNLNYISSISKVDGLFCIMKSKETIPISRRKKDDLMVRLKIK